MKIGFLTFLFVTFTSLRTSAQVLPSDSLALVDLYNATAGTTWTTNTNWLSGNVDTWFGVTVVSNRITILTLTNNNLSGALPSGFCALTALKYLTLSNNNLSGNLPSCFDNLIALNTIDFRNNAFTGAIPPNVVNFPLLADLLLTNNAFDQLPDLSSLTEFSNLLVQNNKFSFEDLEPNSGTANFQYVPQDSTDLGIDTLIDIADTVTFNVFSGGVNNLYQWTKNGSPLSNSSRLLGTTSAAFTINKLTLSDAGFYTCSVTNPLLPGLTLYRRIISLTINDTRTAQTISVLPGTISYCGDGPLKINASTSSGLPLSFSLLTNMAQRTARLKADTLFPFSPGTTTVRLYNDGDDTYQPIFKDTVITVLAPAVAPIEITKLIPEKLGEKLVLSVPFQNNVTFLWINPAKDSSGTNRYQKSVVEESDEGLYTLKVGENNCYYFSESFVLSLSVVHDIVVYELVSPNEDGKNDFFYIQNIEKYQDNEVAVYNTWNQSVYAKTNYTNDWAGGDLPGGTYFYTVKIPSLHKLLKGALYLKR